LDDLVKANKRSGGGGRGRGGRSRGGDNRTGGGAFRRTRNTQRNNPYRSGRGGDSDGVWEHDQFDDEEEEEEIIEEAPARRGGGGGGYSGAGLETGSKLLISGLAFTVNDDDIKDLFEPLGDIKKAFVQYDKSGRSLGQATVVFARRASALEAIKKYNGVPLDGKAMKISLVATAAGAASGGGGGGGGSPSLGARSFRSAVNEATRITVSVPNTGRRNNNRTVGGRRVVTRPARGGSGGGGGGRGGRGRGGAGRGRGRGRQVTKEELDAEMDEYANAGDE